MNIIQRTHLTVGERAILSLVLIALSTGGYTIIDAIAAPGNIDWHNILIVALTTTLVTFGHTLATYLTTHGEIPLGNVLETGTTIVEKEVETPTSSQPRQFVVIPPGSTLTTRAEPIVLPTQEPPVANSEGTTQTPIVSPPFILPPPSQQG